jgi:S1-C subfamily serine protease
MVGGRRQRRLKLEIRSYDFVFPVFGGTQREGGFFVPTQLFGTAFSIGGGLFLTAGHVLRGASDEIEARVGNNEDRNWKSYEVTDSEILPSLDVAIIQCRVPIRSALMWHKGELPMLSPVQSTGYPYGMDPERASIDVRAFAGYVVTGRTHHLLSQGPRAYELSFACPRGLSGAPLFTDRALVCGMVTGNYRTQMAILTDREVTDDGKTVITETYEMLHFGIALQSDSLIGLTSRLLPDGLARHLVNNGLSPA